MIDELAEAAAAATAFLDALSDGDWNVPAHGLDWDCWHTAEHLADAVASYAVQLVAGGATAYVPMWTNALADATPPGLVEWVRGAAGLLVAAATVAPPDRRAYHPTGLADADGFCAMAIVELACHADDIGRGLGQPFEAPAAPCADATARLFPGAPSHPEPWAQLRWLMGRAALDERPQAAAVPWHGAPLGR